MGEEGNIVPNVVYFGTERFTGPIKELTSLSAVSNNWLKMHGKPMVRNRAYAKIKS